MNLLTAIFNAVAGFIRRMPLLCVVVVMLALAAPSVLEGIAVFILYFVLTIFIFMLVIGLVLRGRIRRRMQQRMEEQFRTGFGPFGAGGPGTPGGDPASGSRPREGEVHIRRTASPPEKRVARDVGDYVDFEETRSDS